MNWPADFINQIVIGDALDTLREIPDGVVQCCVTSPPYWGLRDYGDDGQLGLEKTPQEYVAKMVAVFEQVRRVLKQDGTLWLNVGDSYASGKGSCRNPGGGETSFKDYRKKAGAHPLDRGNVSTLAEVGLKPKDLVGIPWMLAFALRDAGWWLRQDIIWSKPNPMPESVRDRCTKAHEYIFLLSKSKKYFFNNQAIKEPVAALQRGRVRNDPVGGKLHKERGQHSPGGRYKVSSGWATEPGSHGTIHRTGRRRVHGNLPGRSDGGAACNDDSQKTRNKRSVWNISTRPYPEAHFATFPPALVEPCVLAGSRPGDIVLDPFGGSGTTALVAKGLGRRFIHIDLGYADLAAKTITTGRARRG